MGETLLLLSCGAAFITGLVIEIEEERRLLYVAMTRAKDNLHLIVPQRFFAHSQQSNGDRHMYASRTRFIPPDILGNFQGCAWPVAAVPAKGPRPPSEPVDISARLRRMWKG
jgi:DNA helicase II / ATP-dependent DNA helicase PcrA